MGHVPFLAHGFGSGRAHGRMGRGRRAFPWTYVCPDFTNLDAQRDVSSDVVDWIVKATSTGDG
ncbi:hypothetical protein LMG919_08285 [Xanthomonas vesicatoria]|nr:hypothetical protein LMG919_08285 [Xanthomonas vesicatoria]